MVHKSSIIPGLSKFLDTSVLSQYPPTSLKRILSAGALALYLQQNSSIVDSITNNPMFSGLGISTDTGMIDIEALRDVYKNEINKAGFLRISFPIIGNVDFTSDDLDTLCRTIMSIDASSSAQAQTI
jgi:hypothetical protein